MDRRPRSASPAGGRARTGPPRCRPRRRPRAAAAGRSPRRTHAAPSSSRSSVRARSSASHRSPTPSPSTTHVARTAFRAGAPVNGSRKHVDLTAAGQPDRPGLLVGDAVRHDARELAIEHRLAALRDIGLDTAARDRSEDPARAGHRQLGAERARGAATGRDDGCDRHVLACGAPLLRLRENVIHRSSHGSDGRPGLSCSRASTPGNWAIRCRCSRTSPARPSTSTRRS